MKYTTHVVAMALIGLVSGATNLLAASLTVSPAQVMNDYVGQVSLSISGLTPGKTVVVERFIDVNGDGLVDAGDALTFSFKVTDGQVPLIGGIRNPNVPGDDDGAANSSIRIDLPFPNVDGVFSSAAAKHLFRVSDPQGGFSSVTATLDVQQRVQPQGVSGRITAAATGAPLAGAFVLLSFSNISPIAAVLTDANGNYSFNAAPGSYTVVAINNGFVSDQTAGAVTVLANQFATRDLALASAGFTISGKIKDISSGAGIAGVFVNNDSTNNLFAGGLSDANGNYSFSVTAGQWEIRPNRGQLAQVGYVGGQKVTINTPPTGAVTIDFPMSRAVSLIYGNVKDGANNPVNGIRVGANHRSGLYNGDGLTFSPSGKYAIGVLAGNWSVGPDSDSLIERGYTGGTGSEVTLNAGQALHVNFVVLPITAHLRGQIRDDSGAPIPNMTIVVQPVPFQMSGVGSIYPTTDSNGNFDVGVRAGTWDIALECVAAQNRGYVNVSYDFNVVDGMDQNGLILAFPVSTATITGSVRDNLGRPIVGVSLDAGQANYGAGCVTTDINGNYTLKVLGGTWNVSVSNDELNALGFDNVASQNVTISGGTATANFVATALPPQITSPTSAAGTLGQLFVYQFETLFATSRGINNLPPGLTFNSALSAVTGVPTAAGIFQANMTASGDGGTTNATLTLSLQSAPASGPVITSGTSATGRAGQRFNFQVTTTGGSPSTRVSASGLPSGLSIDSVTGVISGTPDSEGSSAVTLTVTDAGLTSSSMLQLTFTNDPAIPVIISPSAASLAPGQPFTYTINAPADADPSDVTRFTLIGNLPMGLSFDPATGTISGTFTGPFERNGGSPKRPDLSGGIITNVQLFASNSHGTSTIPLPFFLAPIGAVNISTRIAVGSGDDVLIGGFIITGNAPKKVLIRAVGPSLRPGVPGALEDPMLELHDGGGATLGTNDNWRDTQENEIIDTTVSPSNELESAIVAILNPAGYTAIVRGKNNGTGVALVEVYDLGTASLDASSNAKLAQISTRGTVLTNDDVMIGGFIISGQATRVIVRAIGPELNGVVSGALQDTLLELHDSSGSLIASNDDWKTTQQQAIIDTGVAPTDDRESAIVATLSPGPYTGIVRGKADTTGVALVEVYSLQ